jgi:hypothetical protein
VRSTDDVVARASPGSNTEAPTIVHRAQGLTNAPVCSEHHRAVCRVDSRSYRREQDRGQQSQNLPRNGQLEPSAPDFHTGGAALSAEVQSRSRRLGSVHPICETSLTEKQLADIYRACRAPGSVPR